ncbi:MAG TPA: hypothetical protein VFD76_05360, partial [Gemmatimonadales bacterium]|nr:hypothetical protein [Gemmatimonadales bacterium]
DFGKSWKRISDPLPRSPLSFVHVVREDPSRSGMLYAGTENGVYLTVDDGAHWLPLQTNLPHAPVSWLTVQPHARDLVVATYGRGAWILEDISPLEQLEPATLASTAFLFTPRPAYRFRPQQGVASAPNSAVEPDTVPYGADVTYYVSPSVADTSVPPDTTHRLKPARVVILGPKGDTVRALEGERRPGLNRVWWDLRYTAPTVPKLRTPPPGKPFVRVGPDGTRPLVTWDLDLSLRGPLAPPGTYTVQLTLADTGTGRKAAVTVTQPLIVLKDPNTAGGDSDVQAQARLAMAIRRDQDSTARMINRLEWVRKQLRDLSGQLHGDSALAGDSSAKRIAALADSLDAKALGVEGALFDVHLTGAREDAFRSPIQLYGRLAALQSDVAENGADFAPTAQQLAVHELLAQRLADAARRFGELIDTALPAFGAELRKAPLKDVISAIDGTGGGAQPRPRPPGP